MRLLNKTSKYYAVASLSVFLIGSIVFYFSIKSFVNNDTIEKLNREKEKTANQIALFDSIPSIFLSNGDNITIVKTDSKNYDNNSNTKDTIVFDEREGHEEVPARYIQFYAKSKFYTYQITIVKSLVESDDLIESIAGALFALVTLFLVTIYFINRKISKLIWTPFYDSLNRIKKFDVSDTSSIVLENSDINEFSELNNAITLMTNKIQSDYNNLKEFTENASHEIQTPLAIIQTKLELLIQSDSLNEDQMFHIQSVYDATNRLSKLNQSLLLLAKIENLQFGQKEKVDFSSLVKRHISNYEELMGARNIRVTTDINDNVSLTINSSLADILIGNLFTNAIKHNSENGEIRIELRPDKLIISNTGPALQNKPVELFERFKKERSASESLGLGLSIVRKICETENIQIDYRYESGNHILELKF